LKNVSINTTQNVEIEHQVASVGERILAHLLDYLFFFSYYILSSFLISIFALYESPSMLILLYLPILFYDLVFEIFFNGQNPGKMIMRIRVVRLDGSQPTIGGYLLRWVFRPVDNLLLSGSVSVLTILINGRGQRLGDIAAGTTVIRLKQQAILRDTLYVRLPENYKPVFPQVSILKEDDMQTVKEVLQHIYRNRGSQTALLLSQNTKDVIQKRLGIESNLHAQRFLETILMDYNSLNR